MLIRIDPSSLRETKWHDLAIRFLFGGGITVIAGVLAKKFGPGVGGLFLAFPAIFPAAATLAEKQEVQKKEEDSLNGSQRGIDAAGAEAAGAALGSIGLFGFALVVWTLTGRENPWVVLPLALVAWAMLSSGAWFVRKRAKLGRIQTK